MNLLKDRRDAQRERTSIVLGLDEVDQSLSSFLDFYGQVYIHIHSQATEPQTDPFLLTRLEHEGGGWKVNSLDSLKPVFARWVVL